MKKAEANEKEHSYFYSLELEGIYCFKQRQTLYLSNNEDDYSPWTIILGDNGTGKTTLLRVLDRMQPVNEFPEKDLPHSTSRFFSKFMKADKYFINLVTISNKQKSDYFIDRSDITITSVKQLTNCFILSYGASRRMSKSQKISSKETGFDRLSSPFDESVELINAEEWFLQKNLKSLIAEENIKEKHIKEFELVQELLKDILPDVSQIRIKPVNEENSKILLEVKTSFGWVNLRDLSFGYQTITALLVDIAASMMEKYPESNNPLSEPVIILIDEIDLHLHPKWQRTVIDKLSDYFPKAQFIITAHSPLIVQAAQDRNANIVVCRNEGDNVVIDNNPESVKGWRIDQILTSDLFEVESAQSVKMEKIRNEKINILLKEKLSGADKKRLNILDEKLNNNPVYSSKESIDAEELIKKAAELLKK